MRILLSIAIAFAAMAVLTPDTAEAQYRDGYRFGTGFQFGGGNGFFRTTPREQPPYFAQFPPVYYNGIVPRPYGFSPFALPPGIAPAEIIAPNPVTISNPFFGNEIAPVSNEQDAIIEGTDSNGNKVTWTFNPYVESFVIN